MGGTTLGLVFQIDADESKASEALARIPPAAEKTFKQAAGSTQEFNKSLLTSHQSVHLLAEEMGIRLPRAVVGAASEMLPGISAIGPALLGAFAIAEIPKFIKEVKEATSELAGYTAEVRKAEKADIESSNAALIHFTTIAQGNILIAETNRELANLAAKQGSWAEKGKAASDAVFSMRGALIALLGPITGVINAYRAYKGAQEESAETENRAAQLRERVNAQLEQMTKLQEQRAKESERAAKEAERAQEKAEKEAAARAARLAAAEAHAAMQRIHAMQEAAKEVQRLEKAEEDELATKQRIAKADLDLTLRLEEYGIVEQRQIEGFQKLIPQVTVATNATVHLSAARKELIWITQSARDAQAQWVVGLQAEIQAVQGDLMGNVQAFTTGLAGLIAGRKAQAGVEAIWETARGIALLAEGTWPPNPAALIAAGMHFEAAAQYALLAGSGSHHRGAAGAGGSSRSGVEHGEYGGGRPDYGMPPQTPAPGVSGTGGRFSGLHVTIIGEHQAGQWMAETLNAAVNRGVTLVATSSQRGAPVGH